MKRGSRLTSRTSLDPGCGKRRYRSQLAAEKALARISGLPGADEREKTEQRAYECHCAFWHLTSAPASRPGPGAGKAHTRKDTIPRTVRWAVNARDPWCCRCGSPRDLEQHHRRLKQQGGDPRAHTDCACNLVRLCLNCHVEVHGRDRITAEDEGFIISAEETEPGMHPVLVRTADGGMTAWPSCAGAWVFEAPAEMAAS